MNSFAKNVTQQQLSTAYTNNFVTATVLRLDQTHNVVSGNKWFKLQFYILDAIKKNYNTIATFGGAFSNHIVATAFACKQAGLNSIGFIRGEEVAELSHTLKAATEYGMKLFFLDRTDYRLKKIPENFSLDKIYLVNEGGYGQLGCVGSATIYKYFNLQEYSTIICACGTGTTLAGMVEQSIPQQKIIGINALKGYAQINKDIISILSEKNRNKYFEVNNNFHFGGYAKKNDELIKFMNQLWIEEKMPTDFVYTAKLFYAVKSMICEKRFAIGERLLLIHSGGLQGNKSLPDKTLLF